LDIECKWANEGRGEEEDGTYYPKHPNYYHKLLLMGWTGVLYEEYECARETGEYRNERRKGDMPPPSHFHNPQGHSTCHHHYRQWLVGWIMG
jgi:hypothetical protein